MAGQGPVGDDDGDAPRTQDLDGLAQQLVVFLLRLWTPEKKSRNGPGEKHHELSEQHENQWTDLAGQLIKTDFEDHTSWLHHNRDMLKGAQQAEQAALVKTPGRAFESGRIPGREPPGYQIDRLRGRE